MSYRKIVAVVDEHTASTIIARYAISLAAAGKAELVLYANHAEGGNEVLLLRTEHHLEQLYTVASELNIPVTRIVEAGNISTVLPKRVQAENADLVFYPMTPRERYGTALQKHTVHNLLQTVPVDLAIMRAITMAKPHPGRILVPLGKVIGDKERRLTFVAALAESFHSDVTLFHLFAERETTEIPEDITWFQEQLRLQNIPVQERSGRGALHRAITVEAITRHNDLIVLGASGRGVLRRLFLGNPTGDVMHQPPCNIILFRPAL
jgi:nucleotide-binding universal stress UspA family protein